VFRKIIPEQQAAVSRLGDFSGEDFSGETVSESPATVARGVGKRPSHAGLTPPLRQ
jgi:hypothetical protein